MRRLNAAIFSFSLALLKVECTPSPSGRRLSSQRVTTSVCGEPSTPSSCSDELVSTGTSSIDSNPEKDKTKEAFKEEITDRTATNGSQRTWKDWLKNPAFYKVFLNFF